MSAIKLGPAFNTRLLTAGWSNRSNRFCPTEVFHVLVEQFRGGVGDFLFEGEQHSKNPQLENISHRANRLYVGGENDSELWAEIQILYTDVGKKVMQMHHNGLCRFDVLYAGKMNYCDEIIPESVRYLRVIAYGTYRTKQR